MTYICTQDFMLYGDPEFYIPKDTIAEPYTIWNKYSFKTSLGVCSILTGKFLDFNSDNFKQIEIK